MTTHIIVITEKCGEKSNKYLEWITKWNFDKTVLKTAEWYKSFVNNEDMLKVSTKQIKEFLYD